MGRKLSKLAAYHINVIGYSSRLTWYKFKFVNFHRINVIILQKYKGSHPQRFANEDILSPEILGKYPPPTPQPLRDHTRILFSVSVQKLPSKRLNEYPQK